MYRSIAKHFQLRSTQDSKYKPLKPAAPLTNKHEQMIAKSHISTSPPPPHHLHPPPKTPSKIKRLHIIYISQIHKPQRKLPPKRTSNYGKRTFLRPLRVIWGGGVGRVLYKVIAVGNWRNLGVEELEGRKGWKLSGREWGGEVYKVGLLLYLIKRR